MISKNALGQIIKGYNLNRKTSRFYSITDIQLQDYPILTGKDLYVTAVVYYHLIKQSAIMEGILLRVVSLQLSYVHL